MELSQGGSLGARASKRDGVITDAWVQSCYVPAAFGCKKLKQILSSTWWYPPPPHWTCIHRVNKVAFIDPYHLQKFWGNKPKATTKMTLLNYQIYGRGFLFKSHLVLSSKPTGSGGAEKVLPYVGGVECLLTALALIIMNSGLGKVNIGWL